MKVGVPQGSVLAPTLNSIYMSDIPKHPYTKIIQFADDITGYITQRDINTNTRKIQSHINCPLCFSNENQRNNIMCGR